MSRNPLSSVLIAAESEAQRHFLTELVRLAGFDAPEVPADADMVLKAGGASLAGPLSGKPSLNIVETRTAMAENANCIVAPARAGDIIARLMRMRRDITAMPAEIAIGGFRLDTRENLWFRSGDPVRLTEKETAIIVCLYQAAGGNVARETLLRRIWAYADGVETHTLETHIYRLRQKIEPDPAAPTILITSGDGYRLDAGD